MASLGPQKVFGFDISSDLVAFQETFLPSVNVEFARVFDNHLPLSSATIDWIFVNQVFCNMLKSSWPKCFQEFSRVLKTDGVLVVADSNNPHSENTLKELPKVHREVEVGTGDSNSPSGSYYNQRKAFIEKANVEKRLNLSDSEISKIAANTCYMRKGDVLKAISRYKSSGLLLESPFENDIERAPISIDGGQCSQLTDPYEFLSLADSNGLQAEIIGAHDAVYREKSFVIKAKKIKTVGGVRILRQSIAQIKNYSTLYFRLIRETILLNKKRIALIAALDLSSAVGGGAVLVVLAKIIDSFNTGKPIQSFFFTIPVESNLSYLTVLSVLILFLLLLSAIALFFSKKFNRKLGREYCIKCTQDVLDSVAAMKGLSLTSKSANKGPVYLNQLSMRDTLHASLAMENIVFLIRPALYALVALLIVIKLDPLLTLALLPAGMIILPVLLFRQSRGILSNSKDFYDQVSIARGQAISEAIRHSNSYDLRGLGSPELKVTDIKSRAFSKFLDFFDNNQLAKR